jgi:hypothetical protein
MVYYVVLADVLEGLIPGRVKPKTIKLVFVDSLLSRQYYIERTKIRLPHVKIMCQNGATCLPAKYLRFYFHSKIQLDVLVLYKVVINISLGA